MSRKKKNVILQKILVEDYAAEGKSLARVDGKVVFIEGVVPGDVVDVLLGKNKKDWAEGRPMKFHSYSEMRVQPFCPHFGTCGGCQWQMLPYAKQLEYKERQVRDNLQRIAKVPLPEINSIRGAAETKFYRNKLEYTFGNKRFLLKEELNDPEISGQQDVAGFHARGMFDKIVDIKTCFLQHEPTNAIRNAIKEFARSNNYTFYDIRNHVGFLRTMQVRLCVSGELMVNIVFGEDNVEERNRLLDYIAAEFPMITTLLYTINTKRNDSMFDLEPVPYTGKGYVMEKLVTAGGQEFFFKIGPKSFFQTNTSQGERLYQIAADYAELTGSEVVYDLYCGTGSVGIFVSPGAKKIIGVEMVEAAIEDAKENASLNNIADSAFFAGDVIDICTDEFFEQHGKPDVIITDPPRAGMHEKLVRKILDIAAPVVVYISCNPATQARDLAWLDEKYTVTKVQPVDMFPHTLHIENVVQLKLKTLA
ncbi:MAG: 23S rRNA (uracil(1939)-C(5))-methyltransferase RlmD [Chitinophagaceae bacterium]|nr:MAG: 23S rRNA (uracil(1939)-C(5))-methyltransferase RlmD [Chitinophagaceae bacterium]